MSAKCSYEVYSGERGAFTSLTEGAVLGHEAVVGHDAVGVEVEQHRAEGGEGSRDGGAAEGGQGSSGGGHTPVDLQPVEGAGGVG